ncbi:MAG: aldehyde dehydrogenase (NADP(+)) [Cytophagales bacterium]|nr:aldehyde dehydrogenase (NADP(+)) [Cytophagales bacterium]
MDTLLKNKLTVEDPDFLRVHELMELSWQAFQTYRNVPAVRRAMFLEAIGEEIIALGDELLRTAMKETGLPEGRIFGERGRTVGQLKLFADLIREGSWCEAVIDTSDSERKPVPKADIRKILRPLGPVAVFGAGNFPLAFSVAGGDTASALAGGNTVVVKAHEGHPQTSELVAGAIERAAEQAGMPKGVLLMAQASGKKAGQAIVKHPLCQAVGFTGSEQAGRILFDLAASREHPIPFFAEMGSVNPVLILPQALERRAEELAGMYAGSITMGAGQFCTNPGVLLVPNGKSFERFAGALANEIESVVPARMLNDKTWTGYNEGLSEILAKRGVYLVGQSVVPAQSENIEGLPTVAAVATEVFLENPRLHKEVFGPFSLLVVYNSREELLKAIAVLEGQLTATVMAEELEMVQYEEAVNLLTERSGRLIFNGVPTGVEVCNAMQHGGPYPASTDSRFTSVGTGAIRRFVRPVSYQNWPQALLPEELKDENPAGILRLVDNRYTRKPLV